MGTRRCELLLLLLSMTDILRKGFVLLLEGAFLIVSAALCFVYFESVCILLVRPVGLLCPNILIMVISPNPALFNITLVVTLVLIFTYLGIY